MTGEQHDLVDLFVVFVSTGSFNSDKEAGRPRATSLRGSERSTQVFARVYVQWVQILKVQSKLQLFRFSAEKQAWGEMEHGDCDCVVETQTAVQSQSSSSNAAYTTYLVKRSQTSVAIVFARSSVTL